MDHSIGHCTNDRCRVCTRFGCHDAADSTHGSPDFTTEAWSTQRKKMAILFLCALRVLRVSVVPIRLPPETRSIIGLCFRNRKETVSGEVLPRRHGEHEGHGEKTFTGIETTEARRAQRPQKEKISLFLCVLRVLRVSVVPIHPTPGTYRNPPPSIIDPLLIETTRKRYQERFYHGDTEFTEKKIVFPSLRGLRALRVSVVPIHPTPDT